MFGSGGFYDKLHSWFLKMHSGNLSQIAIPDMWLLVQICLILGVKIESVFHWQFFITYIFSFSLKFGAYNITGQWDEFRIKNVVFYF